MLSQTGKHTYMRFHTHTLTVVYIYKYSHYAERCTHTNTSIKISARNHGGSLPLFLSQRHTHAHPSQTHTHRHVQLIDFLNPRLLITINIIFREYTVFYVALSCYCAGHGVMLQDISLFNYRGFQLYTIPPQRRDGML